MQKLLNLFLCGLLVIGTALSFAACRTDHKKTETTSTVSLPEGTHEKGESVEELGTVSILRQYIEKTGNDAAKPDEGKVYLLLEFRIDNTTDAEMPVSTLLSFTGQADGQPVSPSTKALLDRGSHSTLDGTIPVGGGMVGVVGFEVSQDWKVFQVDFRPDAMQSEAISFAVRKV
ncbi:MAG: DUF4352 domain-containing protein [Clostridiales bacterium]|nr:DUF4352 domain-containing protein [Clostridiales bacterium]